MHMKCIFGFLLLLSVVQFKIILGLTASKEGYEIFDHNYGEYEKTFELREIVRRETRGEEPTREPRPPLPLQPFTAPAARRAPRTSLTQTTERPEFTTTAGSTTISNHIVNDEHKYYKSSYDSAGAKKWWYSLDRGAIPAVLHKRLSTNEQYSDTIKISFDFPYYGHIIDYVTITNKGYVFLGDVVHKFNASSQYVAPLMADFTTHNDTVIAYVDTGERLTVEWTNLRFQNRKFGEFSFQCTILKNGTLIFAYRNIPAPVVELKSVSFQQRVGISDSLRYRILRHGLFIIRGKLYTTIAHNYYFKYHSVNLPMENVRSGSAYVITPLPNCVMLKSCDACVNTPTAFSCAWCSRLQRCSDGVDRYRQQWFIYGCQKNNQTTCPLEESTTSVTTIKQVKNVTTTHNLKYTNMTGEYTKPSPTTVVEGQAERNETTGSQGKSAVSTENSTLTTTTKNSKTTVNPTSKDNETMPTKESPRTVHNATMKVNGTSPEQEKETRITRRPSLKPTERRIETTKNKEPLNVQGNHNARTGSSSSDVSSVGVGLIVLSLVIIFAAFCWFVYAYYHPQTKSGRFLMQHRNPKKWFKNSDGTSRGRMHYKTKSMELSET